MSQQKLQARPKDLELQHRTKSRQPVEVSDLECSSSSVSLGNLDASTSSVGEEGDVEQSRAKYREMKVNNSSLSPSITQWQGAIAVYYVY